MQTDINMDRVSIAIYLLFALSNWVLQLPAAPTPPYFWNVLSALC